MSLLSSVGSEADGDLDRPGRIRLALRSMVAERGFHGASMQAIAKRAGVAAGTAYVHYASKDELVVATYLEAKHELSAAAVVDVDIAASANDRFQHMWKNIHGYLTDRPAVAQFLLQVEASPYAVTVREAVFATDPDSSEHPMSVLLADVSDEIVELPRMVLWDLAVGPVIRLIASGDLLDDAAVERLAESCWRAIHLG